MSTEQIAPVARPRSSGPRVVWSLTLRDIVLLALVAALITVGTVLVHIPLHVPGKSGIVWIALMVVGRGLVRKPGAGLLVGVVAGVLVTLAGLGSESIFTWTKFASAGLTLDVATWALGGDLTRLWAAALAGAAAHLAKLVAMTVAGLLLGLPLTVVAVGLGLTATTHVLFGAVGGALGAVVLHRLEGVPGLGGGR